MRDFEYALASDLKGFADTTLRVRVIRREGDLVWVRTADLRDAGTPLVLNASQIEAEPEPEPFLMHFAARVMFG